MAEHFPDDTKKVDFIRRDKVHVQIERALCDGLPYHRTIDEIPTADVVARDCYDRILAENDTMREQLAQIGKKTGDKMDDVRPVVRAFWVGEMDGVGICSNCKRLDHIDPLATHCRYCGADMREPNLDTTKGDSND